jgi:hypothetical protein
MLESYITTPSVVAAAEAVMWTASGAVLADLPAVALQVLLSEGDRLGSQIHAVERG